MYKKELLKPDGRKLWLYSNSEIADGIEPTNPPHEPIHSNPHMRWHPLRGEWVAYASHRQNRTFLPPKDYSPLMTTKSKEFPTEMPAGEYDMAVFENLFPSLDQKSTESPDMFVPTRAADGLCEVVVFSQDPDTCLGALPVERVRLMLEVMADRMKTLGENPNIQYALPFENRGVEMGVTLHHPHGQIYAYPFIPQVPAKMLESMRTYHDKNKSGLFEDLMNEEIKDGRRIIFDSPKSCSFVPVCARYTYETWVAPKRAAAHLYDLSSEEILDLAKTLKATLMKMDGLWKKPFPYLMVLFQAPLDGQPHPEAHMHFQIYPPLRTPDRLKYLAGTELGGGMYVNDSLPEAKAEELRAVEIEMKGLR